MLILFYETEPAACDLHKGSRKTLRNGGNQGADAGNDLSLHLYCLYIIVEAFSIPSQKCHYVQCLLDCRVILQNVYR